LRERLIEFGGKVRIYLRGLVGVIAPLLFILFVCVNIGTWIHPQIARHTWLIVGMPIASVATAILDSHSRSRLNKLSLRPSTDSFPPWIQAVGTILIVYLVLNFGFFFLNTVTGSSLGETAQTVNNLPLEKTAKWYFRSDLLKLRTFSSFWMLFFSQIAAESIYRNFAISFGRYDGLIKRL
jgi:hypothetical protein